MPRVSEIAILQKNAQHTLSVRAKTQVEKMPVLIGESYGKMAAYIKEMGEHLSDVPYVAFYNMDMQNLDVEIGFPMAKELPDKGEIKSGLIPEGRVIFCMYRGSYAMMEPTYAEMVKWAGDNGLKLTGTCYEHYYNGPDFPEDEMLTMIVMPVM